MADPRLFNADYLKNIGESVIYRLFLHVPEQLTKAESEKKLLLQLGHIKWEIQHSSYKKVSSDQELNPIDSSWVNKPSVDNLYHFR